MSFIIDINDATVWSPALDVGTAFVSCAQALGSVFNASPGFTFIAEDFVEADPEALKVFAATLLARSGASREHAILADLIDAVLVPSLVMLERAGTPIDLSADAEHQVKVDAARRGMPQ